LQPNAALGDPILARLGSALKSTRTAVRAQRIGCTWQVLMIMVNAMVTARSGRAVALSGAAAQGKAPETAQLGSEREALFDEERAAIADGTVGRVPTKGFKLDMMPKG
jgi:hypothetical protein